MHFIRLFMMPRSSSRLVFYATQYTVLHYGMHMEFCCLSLILLHITIRSTTRQFDIPFFYYSQSFSLLPLIIKVGFKAF